jgi:uncharacterized protein
MTNNNPIEFDADIQQKIANINDLFEDKKVIISFSGGVDSSLLAAIAMQVASEVLLFTVASPLMSQKELDGAIKVAEELNLSHIIVSKEIATTILHNPKDRCYHCKKNTLKTITDYARENSFDLIAEGTNASELKGYRPGFAATKEMNVKSPFADFQVTKKEIREMARSFQLSVVDKPSSPCFATRIPYHSPLDPDRLLRVMKAEELVTSSLESKRIRVRDMEHDVAKIELDPESLNDHLSMIPFKDLILNLKKLGYKHITLDLEGYRSGVFDD